MPLIDEVRRMREAAKNELLAEIATRLADLREIGYGYAVVDAAVPKTDRRTLIAPKRCRRCRGLGHNSATCPALDKAGPALAEQATA